MPHGLGNIVKGRMNGVRWRQPFPMWARIFCVLFGLANIGGAIAQASDMTFPGIVVGAVWALFGWKGLPLIASVPRDPLQQEGNIARGVKKLRRRRLLVFLAPFVWLVLAAMVLPRVPERLLPTAFFLSAVPVVFLVFRAFFSACSRCGQHFFLSDKLFRTSLIRCLHCGLSLSDKADATADYRKEP